MESKVIEINMLGNSQREQWKTVVNCIRSALLIGNQKDALVLCDEVDRYIDFAEDVFEKIKEQEKS